MTESRARAMLAAATTASIISAVAAMAIGLRGDQGNALIFLGLAVLGAFVSFSVYRRYKALRDVRWQRELRESEDKLTRVLEGDAAPEPPAPHEQAQEGSTGTRT